MWTAIHNHSFTSIISQDGMHHSCFVSQFPPFMKSPYFPVNNFTTLMLRGLAFFAVIIHAILRQVGHVHAFCQITAVYFPAAGFIAK
jgi:hypothetical protein